MKRGRKYFIQEHLQEPYLNGGIGYTDIEKILLQEGFQPIFFPCHFNRSFFAKIRRFLYLFTTLVSLPKGGVVAFLCPQYAIMNRLLVKCLGWRRSIRRVAILGDINGVKHNNEQLLQEELKQFERYDFLILHNRPMQSWMATKVNLPSAVLHFFDFLTEPVERISNDDNGIVYAGSLDEGMFLEKADMLGAGTAFHFNVYGQPVSEKLLQQTSIRYMGVISPYELPAKVQGRFGLVWYGDDLSTVAGNIGNYLPIISPHKASLYIICGIPLIVQEGTAIAALVKQWGIGITVKSLYELKAALGVLSHTAYETMRSNTKQLAKEIAAGHGLRNALHEMEKALGKGFDREA